MVMSRVLGSVCAVLMFAGTAAAQRLTSPPASASVKIAGKQITVDYYAPSMHGRKIMGSLVPWGKVWCPGAKCRDRADDRGASADRHLENS